MLTTKVSLRNFIAHRELDIELAPGINGIVGANGSGKSSILDAIRFGYTGESASYGAKVDNVTWGESSGKVVLEFIHDEVTYRLERSLGKKTSQKLVTPDYEFTKKADIDKFIADLTGASIEALLNNVFVPQGAIDSILFSTRTKRLKEIQQTIGMLRAAEAERALGAEVGRYSLTPGLKGIIESTQDSLNECESEVERLRRELDAVGAEIEELKPLTEPLERALEARRVSKTLRDLEDRIQETLRTKVKAEEACREVRANRDAMRALTKSTEAAAEQAREDLVQLEVDRRAFNVDAKLREQLKAVDESLAKVGSVESPEELEAREQVCQTLRRKVHQFQDQLSGKIPMPKLPDEEKCERELKELKEEQERLRLFAAGKCPTCGQDANHLVPEHTEEQIAFRVEDVRALLRKFSDGAKQALRESFEKAKATLDDSLSAFRVAQERVSNRSSLLERKQMLEEQISGKSTKSVDETAVSVLQKVVDDHERATLGLAAAETDLQLAEQWLESVSESHLQLCEQKATIGAVEDISEEDLKRAQEAAERVSARTQFKNITRDRLGLAEVKLEEYQRRLESLQTQLETEARDAAWVSLCKRVREVMHVSGLPSLMMGEYASLLNRRMKYYLNVWEAPFTMRLDEDDLEFMAEFSNGLSHAAARLSGGQKIVAATSLRLAMADTFARQAGLLILDEPSNYLDKSNLAQFQTLLLKLKELAGSTGRQIILVTHEESLMGFFDHTINLQVEETT